MVAPLKLEQNIEEKRTGFISCTSLKPNLPHLVAIVEATPLLELPPSLQQRKAALQNIHHMTGEF